MLLQKAISHICQSTGPLSSACSARNSASVFFLDASATRNNGEQQWKMNKVYEAYWALACHQPNSCVHIFVNCLQEINPSRFCFPPTIVLVLEPRHVSWWQQEFERTRPAIAMIQPAVLHFAATTNRNCPLERNHSLHRDAWTFLKHLARSRNCKHESLLRLEAVLHSVPHAGWLRHGDPECAVAKLPAALYKTVWWT